MMAKRIYDLVLNKLKTLYFATCFGQQQQQQQEQEQEQEQYLPGFPLSCLHSGTFRFIGCLAIEQIN